MTTEAVQLSYPTTIKEIPYASFLQIKRWSYDQAQKEVMKNQSDAAGLVTNSNTFNKVEEVENALVDQQWMGDVVASNKVGSTEQKIRNMLAKELFKEQQAITSSQIENLDPVASAEGIAALEQQWAEFQENIPEDLIESKLAGKEWATEAIAAEKERKEEFARKQKGLVNIINGKSDHVDLALPNEFQYGYGADWSNTFKLGTLALLAEKPVTALGLAATAGGVSSIASFATNFASRGIAGNIGEAFANGVKTAIDPFNVGTKINPANIAGLAGLAPNENAMQFFKKMDFRQFDLNFQMAARNSTESNTIEQIIQWFKVAMHPGTLTSSGSSVLLGFPDVFELVPRFVAGIPKNADDPASELQFKPVRHRMMPKTKLCALTNLKINATPMAQLQTVFDGTIPLITMSLTFTELTALTKADFGYGQVPVPELNQKGMSDAAFNQRSQDDFYNY